MDLTRFSREIFPDLMTSSFDANDAKIVAQKNCENFIGSIEIPVGVAGPVLVISDVLSEEIFLPLATTEGALVASVSRGCKAIQLSGGAQANVKKIGMTRAPVFCCNSGKAARDFVTWFDAHMSEFAVACKSTSQHLKYISHMSWIQGRNVYVRFVFDTDEAMGMNMVTIALQQAWEKFQKTYARDVTRVQLLALSSNLCSDKKDSVINRVLGRGYWVQAEVVLPSEVIRTVLKTTPEDLLRVHTAKNVVGSSLSGSFSQNMHAGNMIAALYAATGQDLAHITEGSQANTTFEASGDGLYVAVTLPNLVVGTVGGGTWLPKQTQARRFIRQNQDLSAAQLAVAIATACLAGEISGMAALASNSLAQAHQRLARTSP